MQQVCREVHRGFFSGGFMSEAGAKRHIPERPTLGGAYAVDGGNSHATIEEWVVGEAPNQEVVARKVLTASHNAYWLRADYAAAVMAWIAGAELERERVIGDVIMWATYWDEHNAAKRGMTVEQYRRERNAQGHRSVMKSGINSIGM